MYRGFGHHGLLQLVLWHLQRDLQHLGVVGLRGHLSPLVLDTQVFNLIVILDLVFQLAFRF